MPLYRITAPNGRTYQIEGPEGASDADVARAVMAQFPESAQPAPETTALGHVKEAFKGLVPGAVGLLESAATGASALLPEDMEKAAREKIASVAGAAKKPFEAAPGYEQAISRKLSEAVGSTVPFLAAGPLGLAGRAAAVGLGVGAGAGEARTRAEREGATEEQRSEATALGMIPGALEAFAPLRILSRIPTASTAAGVEMVKRALVAGGEEAAQEAASNFAQNLIARGIYKPEQELIEGLGESAAYGGATGAIVQGLMDLALGRRAKGTQPTQPPAAEPTIPPTAAAGTQGALFGAAETPTPARPELNLLGQPLERAPGEPAPSTEEVQTPPLPGQEALGLDYARQAEDVTLEIERLKQQPQTPEVKERIAQLRDDLQTYSQLEVERIRAEKEATALAAKEDEAARTRFPALAAAPELMAMPDEVKARTQGELFAPEEMGGEFAGPQIPAKVETATPIEPAEPTPVPPYTRTGEYQYKLPLRTPAAPATLTMKDVEDTGIAPSTTRGWFEQNVVGKTQPEVRALVEKDPTLLEGKGKRAKILRELLAPQAAPFKEPPNVPSTPKKPAPEQRDEPRAGEPSMGVSRQPAAAVVPEPRAGVAGPAGAPATPDRRGLVPAGQPAVPGAQAQGIEPAAVTEPPLPEMPKPAAVQRLESSRTRAEFDAALDELVAIQRSPDHPDKDAVGEFIGSNVAKYPEFERALQAAELRNRPKQTAPAPAQAAREEEPSAPKKPFVPRKPDAFYEPVGLDPKTGKVIRGPQMLVQPIDDARAKRMLEERAKEDVGEGKDIRDLFGSLADEIEAEAAQPELDFTKEPEPEPAPAPTPEAPAPTPEATQPPAPQLGPDGMIIEPWATEYDRPGFTAVYADEEVALVRVLNAFGGQVYVAMSRARNGSYTKFDIEAYTGTGYTDAQKGRLMDARAKAVFAESRRAAKNPDGPFTGAATNVAKSESVDQRYADMLHGLMQSMGLGDVRVFLVHPDDVRAPGAIEKYKLYKSFATVQAAGSSDTEDGSTQTIGPEKRDFYISFKAGMSENKSIEVITHELGHMIQSIAFNNAPAAVQNAIYKEHDAWLQSTKGKSGRELVQLLRNRETAETQMLAVPESATAEQMSDYWTSFKEWFADNVSRWASTAEKPVSITEKFFARVAQMMRDLVATVTGRKYPPNTKVAAFLDAMGPGSSKLWMTGTDTTVQPSGRAEFSIAPSTESLIDSMGPLDPEQKTGLKALIPSFTAGVSPAEPGYAVKFRTQTADAAATIEHRLREQFDGAVRDSLGKLNPMGLYRQAQDYTKTLLEYFQVGGLVKDPATGLWVVQPVAGVRPPAEVYSLIDAWGAKNGYDRDRATQIASRVLEGVRLDAMRTSNRVDGTNFLLHLKDPEIDQLVAEYNADPDLQAMSKAMDEARIAMVDNMVAVGRLTKETGEAWKDVIGYVPFDRLDDEGFSAAFSKIKKVSNKGLAQLGKLPELVGSEQRPVGNVFENYLNTLGWMVGQTMKSDANTKTLRSLEDLGYAKFLGRSTQRKANTVGAYVNGEMMYWELPSKYDVLAFKDMNPQKAGWLRNLGKFSNVLRKSVTALPPFALKQVTDDVQRAIMTSGVKNPGALLRMSLSNFGGLALAELRGIQHPSVKQFGRMGLTGEYDFEAGKPATSLLKDLGYKKRGKFETLLHRLDGITRASDLAVRKAIYDQTLKETNDQLLAQTRAREFINFRRRGASDFVGAMVTTIPFFNAYIQGMDVLYRAASGKDSSSSVGRSQARRMFWSRAGTVMMLSSLYALGAGDDEDYQEMDLRTRDSNWILPGGFKLPVPTELGALFKVIPERVVEYMRRQGTPEEQTAWEATRTALTYMFEQYVGRTVPVPQAVKPLLEAWTNYSFFTGRELEGIYQKQQDPSMRRAANTSELAIAIANFARDVVGVDKVSPILVDNALNGYFGSSAGLLVAMTDSLLNPTRVDRPLHKWALVSNYMYDPVGTRRMTEFYEAREKVGRANATLNELMKTDIDRAAAYAEKNADLLMLEGAINSTLEQLERTRAYRKYLNSPDGAKDMPKAARETELQELRRMEVELTGWLREAKTAVGY